MNRSLDLQFWPDHRAVIRMISVNKTMRNQNVGSRFLTLTEKWLKSLHIKKIQAESRKTNLKFYFKNGYTEMLLNDPESHEPDPSNMRVGKFL